MHCKYQIIFTYTDTTFKLKGYRMFTYSTVRLPKLDGTIIPTYPAIAKIRPPVTAGRGDRRISSCFPVVLGRT